jgi:peptidoglycan-associated lipoprotein
LGVVRVDWAVRACHNAHHRVASCFSARSVRGHTVSGRTGAQNHRTVASLGLALVAGWLAACSPSYPKCSDDGDCNKDGHKGVCIDGTCQECGKNQDCQPGFECHANRCVPKPECASDSECTAPKICWNGKCILECSQDADCKGGQVCKGNRCTPRTECTVDTDCGKNGKCVQGQCAAATGDCVLESIKFAYNEAVLDDQAKAILQKDVECMKARPPHGKVSLEGNCDERGTEEYNLHLGQRRADATIKYLVNLGVSKAQLKTLSWGKNKPICTESHEGCWSQNRRVDITESQ